MSELKKCPFCGGEAAYTQILGNYERPHEVYCSTCDGGITEGRSKDGVIHNWNTRPIEDALKARIAKLEAENAMLKQLPQPIKFWSDEKKQIYKINERRTAKSGSEECGK